MKKKAQKFPDNRGGYLGADVPRTVEQSDLTYTEYLKIPELLSLQVPQSSPAHHDEYLFIIIHQAYELWFKLILHEIEAAMEQMQNLNVLRAHHFMKRVTEIMRLLVSQIHILETMSPVDFLEFRDRLMPASGFQSLQFRELEFALGLKDPQYMDHFKNKKPYLKVIKARYRAKDLRQVYYEMLHALGLKVPKNAAKIEDAVRDGKYKGAEAQSKLDLILSGLKEIYQHSEQHLPLYLLSESMIELDEYLSLWRVHHVHVVKRVIGFRQGTGGSSGVNYLKSTTTKSAFPLLWEVRTHLSKRGEAKRGKA